MHVTARVLELVGRRTGLQPPELHDDIRLGDPAIGLDSVALLELVLECERACGCRLDDDLLARQPLTLGALIAGLREAMARAQ